MTSHRPRKRFGQNFLVDIGVVDEIIRAICPTRNDTIVEIGPGRGALTESLALAAGKLHLVELDRDLAKAQRERWASDSRVVVHEADALRFDFRSIGNDLRIVGNLPYNISTPLLFRLLEQRDAIRDMHFMLQKEVVDRITAAPGSKAYGRLSIMLQVHLAAEALFDVGPEAFEPRPAVRSAILRLYPLPDAGRHAVDDRELSGLLASAFSQRRKTLRNALKGLVSEAQFAAAGIDPASRAEAIPVGSWVELTNLLAAGR